jgi:hypothetical protein
MMVDKMVVGRQREEPDLLLEKRNYYFVYGKLILRQDRKSQLNTHRIKRLLAAKNPQNKQKK